MPGCFDVPLPIPTYLQGLLVPLAEGRGEEALRASVRCPCGGTRFELRHSGASADWDGKPVLCDLETETGIFFRIEARCAACGRDHLLFDKDFHGWDGLFCRDPRQAALPRPALVAWACRGCGGLHHRLIVTISGESLESFLEEADGEHGPEVWPDAFGWFALDSTCDRCGRDEPELISFETM